MVEEQADLTIITLGGTIASVPEHAGGSATPSLTADDLVTALPQLSELVTVQAHSFRQYPSGDLNIADLNALAREITAQAAAGRRGFVITQGADTLEETAYLLDLSADVQAPVVLTGAMRHAGLPGADGPANLLAAARVAVSEQARGLGALVVMNDEVHAARWMRKTHTSSTAAFASPGLGPLGWVSEDQVRIPLVPRQRTPRIVVGENVDLPHVALLRLGLGSDATLIEHLADLGYDAAVIEVYGGGHASQRTVHALHDLATCMPVVFASRTGAGELLTDTYGFPASERDLLERGLISAGARDGLKARLLLSMLLASGADRQTLQHHFHDSVTY